MAWLNSVLGDAFPRLCSLERAGGHAGTTDRTFLLLHSEGVRAAAPRRVFLKMPPPAFSAALFGNLMGLGRNEVGFYRQMRGQARVWTPDIFYADYHPKSARFILLMEDLAEAGCRFSDVGNRCTLEEAQTVMKALADLHASFWESPRFNADLRWVGCFENEPRRDLLSLLRRLTLRTVLAKYPDIIPEAVKRNSGLYENAYDRFRRFWSKGPRTLLHGDPHIGNLFFKDGRVGFFDWQVIWRGQGMRDVSYFLVNSVPTATRQQHQRDLIALYLERLEEQGAGPIRFEAAWQQYRSYAVYSWYASVVTSGAGNLQAPEIARAGLVRTTRALEELDPLGALNEDASS